MFNQRYQTALAIIASVVLVIGGIYLLSLTFNSIKAHDYIGKSPDRTNQITVEGTAKVNAKPDIATLQLGVISDKATVAAAQEENTAKMNGIIAAVKDKFKVKSEDITTSQYQINPRYDFTNGTQRIVGYTVSQNVTVKVRDFDKVGEILAAGGSLGANSVNGPSFAIDDPDKARAEARQEAINEAQSKARELANQLNVKLGSVVGFSEGGMQSPMPMFDARESAVGNLDMKAIAPAIEPGSQEVNVSVQISYEIL
ncbi:MAG: SIMPL domain-containing protein [Candidatus Buchananbacteria bacterium]|nr:SIMPL domain-containing protein [Candidatus Buchananbacteria bacterium]